MQHQLQQADERQPAIERVSLPKNHWFTNYIVIATNVPLDDIPKRSLDKLQTMFDAYAADLDFRGWAIWHLKTYCNMLDNAGTTRRDYIAEIAPEDVLDRLHKYDVGISERVCEAIKLQMINELKADQWVRLSQAGNRDQTKLPLSEVGIDLPAKDEAKKAARVAVESGDAASSSRRSGRPANLLLLGGPGQGKSTLTQLIGQSYRIALLRGLPSLRHDTRELLQRFEAGLREAGIPIPALRRWPVRVDLANYADAAVNYRQTSLLKYIAEQADRRNPGTMNVAKARIWLKAWPWLLILDGFDEVASSQGREALMEQLANFMGEVEVLGADVFVLATTRPQGYADEFRHQGYRHVELAPLETRPAMEYGLRLARARHGDDPDMQQRIIERIEEAANDQFTARLMRSPLQVTIMSILLEARKRVPRARYELFQAYYETIYARESAKPGPLAALLEERVNDINALHDRLGLILQVKSEKAGGQDASMARADLLKIILQRLRSEGHDDRPAAKLAGEILRAVTARLVLIVPTKLDDVGFEVRSIQEFFAARNIGSGPDSQVLDRLARIIESAHWRNTWLFAAGKTFGEREHVRRDLVALLSEADNRDLLHTVVAPGSDLALDLLEDDVARQSPRAQRHLYRQALELLKYPPDSDLRRRAHVLFGLAVSDDFLAFLVEQIATQAIAGTPTQLESARSVLEFADRSGAPRASKFRPLLREITRSIRERTRAPLANGGRTVGDLIADLVETAHLTATERERVLDLASRLQVVRLGSQADGDTRSHVGAELNISRELLDECLASEPVGDILANVTVAASGYSWQAGAALRNVLRSWVQRRPAGDQLLDAGSPYKDPHASDAWLWGV